MARLLPLRSEIEVERNDEPSILYVDNDQTKRVLNALSSDTTLSIFRVLTDRGLSTSEVADELDMSTQNATYHLRKLQEADLIEVIDTCYSEKGREMEIFAATNDPKVVILGTSDERSNLRQVFKNMAGVLGLPAVFLAIGAWASGLVESVSEA